MYNLQRVELLCLITALELFFNVFRVCTVIVHQLNYTFPFVLLLSIAECASDSLLNTVIMFSQHETILPIFMFSCAAEAASILTPVKIKSRTINGNSNSNNRIHAHTEAMHSDDISMLNEVNIHTAKARTIARIHKRPKYSPPIQLN